MHPTVDRDPGMLHKCSHLPTDTCSHYQSDFTSPTSLCICTQRQLTAPTCPVRKMGNHGSNLDDILAEDMHHWYNKFMRESPSGQITLFELKAMLGLQGMNEDASSYVDQVFFTFDMDGVRD
ncbi:guanylyl cyclase-activating protein 3-like [Arapaima gigas]